MSNQILNRRTFTRALVYFFVSLLLLALTAYIGLWFIIAGADPNPNKSANQSNSALVGLVFLGLLNLLLPIVAGYLMTRSEHRHAKKMGLSFDSKAAALSGGAPIVIAVLPFLFTTLLQSIASIRSGFLSGSLEFCLVGPLVGGGLGALGGALYFRREGNRKIDSSTIESDAQIPAPMPVAEEARVDE